MMTKKLRPLALLSTMGLVIAVSAPVPAHAAAPKSEAVYNTYCTQCHGINRNGKGVNSPAMAVQPRDHSDAKGMTDIPDNQLFKAIKEGGMAVNKSALMPAWGDVLSDDDVKGLVAYLRQVCKCGSTNK